MCAAQKPPPSNESQPSKNRWVVVLTVMGVIAFSAIIVLWVIFVDLTKQQYTDLILKHFPALVGLPMAAIASFFLVTFLRQRSGEGIKFKGLGFEFNGPSGEVILWILCFVTITVAIKAVW